MKPDPGPFQLQGRCLRSPKHSAAPRTKLWEMTWISLNTKKSHSPVYSTYMGLLTYSTAWCQFL